MGVDSNDIEICRLERRSLRSSDGRLIAGCEVWNSTVRVIKASDNLVLVVKDAVKGNPT